MDIDGLERLLAAKEAGRIRIVAKDVTEPSPLAAEILTAKPYAFLDDAPLEERRTQAVVSRRWLDPESASDLGRLDPEAIARVREEAWPSAETPDELHDALMWMHTLSDAEIGAVPGWRDFVESLIAQRRVAAVRIPAGPGLWIAVERLPVWRAAVPDLQEAGEMRVPEEFARAFREPEIAMVEIVRGRLEASGPVRARDIARATGLAEAQIDAALLRLEAEGFAMRGQFTGPDGGLEWCERRLLARIHRSTVKRLRAEIEPVSAADCMRFLLRWQHVATQARMAGPDAVAAMIGMLEGYEAPAAAWETELLPARVSDYDPEWLDELCLKGRAAWMRVSRPRPEPGPTPAVCWPVKVTPITLLTRRNLPLLAALAPTLDVPSMRSSTQAVYDYLAAHGASFFDEIVHGTGQLHTQTEASIAELVSLGLLTADSFIGLRALLLPLDRRKPIAGGRRRRRAALFGIEDAGRWTLTRRSTPGAAQAGAVDAVEQVARLLLKRYGVVFWKLLERESGWLPPWRDLLRAYRRLEARGEIRGGRFAAGFSGEQFALPEAVSALREARRAPRKGELVAVSGADPLNLVGILTPGPKVPALTGNRVLYRDGVPVAWSIGSNIAFADAEDASERNKLRDTLVRRPSLAPALGHLV
jgi:ATP-dependent Lhr-like helicase